MAKRLCTSLSRVSDPTDRLLGSLLALSEADSLTIPASFDRLVECKESDTEQIKLIERANRLGSVLREAASSCERKRAERHNSVVWSIPSDITIKIFTMMDTKSIVSAAATCSSLRKCAEDPLCHSNIDLTTESPKVNDLVVSTLIHRAGKGLRSLRLGIVPVKCTSVRGSQSLTNIIGNSADASGFSLTDKRSIEGKESSILTRSCLSSLSDDGGVYGALLKRLHLYNIERMDNVTLGTALSACPSLRDLEVVDLRVELSLALEFVSNYCHLIEHLHVESSKTDFSLSGRYDGSLLVTCRDLVSNCPRLTSLALKGFNLDDYKVRILLKGFQKLKYADFSTSYSIKGSFLRNLGTGAGERLLEVLILRDCKHLRKVEVSQFLTAVIGGDLMHLRHFDISNTEGLELEGDWFDRCCSTSFIPFEQLLERRPGFCLLAEFPQEEVSHPELEDLNSNDSIAVTNSPSEISSYSSDYAIHITSSDNSSNSDSDEWDNLGI